MEERDKMIHQKSYQNERPTLYLVSTPIGNLDDITYRAVKILNDVNVIYAEDTRTSQKLLSHYQIKTRLISYHTHNEQARTNDIIETMGEGKNAALISDAGTPLISDPGAVLISMAIEKQFNVVSIPGPTAFISALTVSNLSVAPSLFYGFLPSKTTARKKILTTLASLPYTLIFYEAPHRILSMLEDANTVLGNRKVVIARELTKRYEEIIHFHLSNSTSLPPLKGEIVVMIEGSQQVPLDHGDVIAHIDLLIADGKTEMEAIKYAAKQRKMTKNDVYMTYQNHKKATQSV